MMWCPSGLRESTLAGEELSYVAEISLAVSLCFQPD